MVQFSTKYRKPAQLKQTGSGQKPQKSELFRLRESNMNFVKRPGG